MDGQEHGRTELDDLRRPYPPASVWFSFARGLGLFAAGRAFRDELAQRSEAVPLAPSQLYHPPPAADVVVRRGRLRVSVFLPDGREVTRAVLQNGSVFRTRPATPEEPAGDAAPERTDLAAVALMALGETELWVLPPGGLDRRTGEESKSP